MSDIDGLYDGDPRENPDAKIIPLVTEIDDHIRAVAGGAGSAHAKGGMVTKITAALDCDEGGHRYGDHQWRQHESAV